MKNAFAKRLLSLVLLVGTGCLVLGAAYALRRNCESFGCPNAGVLWTAWTAVYAVVVTCGLRLRAALLPKSPSRAIVTASLAALAVLGIVLSGYWLLVHNAT